ncbi:MAG TPA: single-stranded DNA-binding protein, partial [Sandaracinaceae bacterium]
EALNKYLSKGQTVYVEGRLQTRSWEDKDGNKRYKTEIVANELLFLGGGRGGAAPSGDFEGGYSGGRGGGGGDDFPPDEFGDDDIPF